MFYYSQPSSFLGVLCGAHVQIALGSSANYQMPLPSLLSLYLPPHLFLYSRARQPAPLSLLALHEWRMCGHICVFVTGWLWVYIGCKLYCHTRFCDYLLHHFLLISSFCPLLLVIHRQVSLFSSISMICSSQE